MCAMAWSFLNFVWEKQKVILLFYSCKKNTCKECEDEINQKGYLD